MQIVLGVRRFCSHNATCSRRTFAEHLLGLLAAHARHLPAGCGAERDRRGSWRLCRCPAAAAIGDACQRRHVAAPDSSTCAARRTDADSLGGRYWAFERGNTYGTLLVDLESRGAVDLLLNCWAETSAAWLCPRRRKIKVVASDPLSDLSG